MLTRLAYLNLFFAAAYFLLFLQAGGGFAISGSFMVVIFALLCAVGKDASGILYRIVSYFCGAESFIFAIFLLYSGWHIMADSIAHAYYSTDSVLLTIFSGLFGVSILALLMFFIKRSLNN
ncbi:hypothetical protein [Pedobacter duraquae]|uniref:Uncharacterized protein n=1 Tax=Pedobacter duraquae TaxID=425511 RepID=A0A4R6IGT2_9SPHI|nr:hypothetical protein [Pedobacter duraquae]TDO21382.1 hypothetical protein CLV32_2487 [Pedobacter duraquae]